MNKILSKTQLLGYGALGVPVAFVGLPIYVHLPHYYATTHGLDLALIGIILLLVRLFDALQDPLIGFYSDKTHHSNRRLMLCALPLLTISFIALFSPPELSHNWLVAWLVASLLLTYTAFNMVMINYFASSTLLPQYVEKTTLIAGVREGAMLLGVVIAAAAPALLQQKYSADIAFRYFALCFVPLAIIGAIGINYSLRRCDNQGEKHAHSDGFKLSDVKLLRPLLPLYALFLANSLPVSITSTLFLFYVEDYLKSPAQSGYFLLCFFVSAAASVPIWVWLSGKIGNWVALRIGMAMAIASFICTIFLQGGDVSGFYIVCAVSGFAVGGDLTLLPAIFTVAIANHQRLSASAFSIWHFLAKFNLALAAGLLLPLLSYFGYQPKMIGSNGILLVFYAIIPCSIKVIALLLTYNKKLH